MSKQLNFAHVQFSICEGSNGLTPFSKTHYFIFRTSNLSHNITYDPISLRYLEITNNLTKIERKFVKLEILAF